MGTYGRRPAVVGSAHRTSRTRPGCRSHGGAVAAGLSQDAGRAAEGCSQSSKEVGRLERVRAPGSPRAYRVEVPEELRATGAHVGSDYTSACEVAVPATDVRSAEQWARDVFEGAPQGLRQFVVFGWIVA